MSVPKIINVEGQELVLLPTTPEDLDEFVASITEEFGLPPGEGTYQAIATAIMHMPPNKAYAPRLLFGHSGLKQMANTVAYNKLAEFDAKRRAAAKEQAEKQAQEANLPAGAENGQPIQNP